MVSASAATLDRVFHALAHPARRAIVRRLASGERNLSELAEPLKMTFPAASKHVRVLEAARLVRRRVDGRQHLCRLHAGPLKCAADWTAQFREHWEQRFQALDVLLAEMSNDERGSAGRR
jgi:DNA-binding transcriptional ArsR family regulator